MSAPTRAGTPQPSLPASRKGTVQSRATDVGLKSRIWELGAQCGKACPGSSNLNHGSECSSQTALASYLSSPLHGLQKSQLGRQDWVKLGQLPCERLGATERCGGAGKTYKVE